MREFKFRAWDKEEKKLIYMPHFTLEKTRNLGLMMFFAEDDLDHAMVDEYLEAEKSARYELMQFTGFKDKNGKDSYDKDLIRYSGHYVGDRYVPAGIGIIEWGDDGWIVRERNGTYVCDLADAFNDYDAEIIGNSVGGPMLTSTT